MTAEELLQRYAAGERDFQEIDIRGPGSLEGKDLSGINLSGATLAELPLNDCNFRGADLEEANLSRAMLPHSIADNANFRNATLARADLRCVSMENVDWS